MSENEKNDDTLSRRRFLKNTGMVAGGVVGGSVLGGLLTNQFATKQDTATKGTKDVAELQHARVFFSRKEDFETLSAATECILPEDDLGPGAIELGVPYFIDRQLAGSWGTNAKEYMNDPFWQTQQTEDYQHKDTRQDKSGPNTSTKAPTPTPRYQSRLNRGDIFIQGLRKMEQVSQEKFKDKFINRSEEQTYKLN